RRLIKPCRDNRTSDLFRRPSRDPGLDRRNGAFAEGERLDDSKSAGDGYITEIGAAKLSRSPIAVLRAAHVLGPGAFRSIPDVKLDTVTFPQILKSFALHGAPMKEVLLS